jgi:hypothetical protein
MSRDRLKARGRRSVVCGPRTARLAGVLMLLSALAAALASLTLATRAARADYQGPDENTNEAYGPLRGDYSYSATLQSANDQDWYYFYVPAAGDKLHWTVANTTPVTGCNSGIYSCSVYATLEDSNGQQVGGADSSAGTSGVAPTTTQNIDWTFDAPGKYYLAVIGDSGQLSYQFSVTPASGLSSTAPGGGGRSSALHLKAHQSGRDVEISLVVPTPGARLDAGLYTGAGHSLRTAGLLRRAHLPRGTVKYAIELSSRAWTAAKKHHRLTLTLRVVLTMSTGAVEHATEKVVVTYPR